jgi:NAD(P)-dependent dehydrogenase (short-subunit alcohol dehydrogenase family)
MKEITGKVAVVTGASSGIGRAIANRFADHRMKIVLADVDRDGLDETASQVAQRGGEALSVITDVSRQESVDTLADRAWAQFGQVDILCNNAGVLTGGISWELDIKDYEWLMGVNTFGVVHGVRSFVPRMIAQDTQGHVVNTASMAALTSMPFAAAYHMSKHAVLAFSECLHHELTQTGTKLKVSALCPELIDTGIHESERCRTEDYKEDGQAPPLSDSGKLVIAALAEGMKKGLDPDVMAGRVLDGILEERFYLLSEDSWRTACETRLDDIRLGRNPTFSVPG